MPTSFLPGESALLQWELLSRLLTAFDSSQRENKTSQRHIAHSSHKLAFLLQGARMAERISGATDKRSEIKNGPIDR